MNVTTPPGPTIGLVGCGAWGRFILRDLLGLGCRVVVADPAAESRAHALGAGASAARSCLDDLPAGLAGLVVATPTSSHAAVIESLLPRGVPLFVEKPLTADADAARDLARRVGDRLFVMDKWRYHPGVEAIAAIVRSGELGPVRRVSTLRLGWRDRRADADTVWSLLPHDLAIALEILGELPAPIRATTHLAAGAVVSMSAVLGREPELRVEVSDRHPVTRREIVVDCLDGSVQLAAADADHVAIRRNAAAPGASPERRAIGDAQPLQRELAAFLAHLRGGPPPRSSAAAGAAAVAAIARLVELGRCGRSGSAAQDAAAAGRQAPERLRDPP